MNIKLYSIDKRQTSVIKAVAITMIVFHNFLHILHDIGENEMDLSTDRVFKFFSFIQESFWNIPDALFSFLGHYGVELFIFCSGYGLCKQFLKKKPESYKSYIVPKVLKIYLLLLVGLISCFVFLMDNGWMWFLKYAVLCVTMVRNFSVYYLYAGVGPWWYFSLVIQLYLLFPLLFYILKRYQKKGLYLSLLVSYVLIYALTPIADMVRFPIYGNCIGHLPEFILGIGFAMIPDLKLNWKITLAALLVFVLGNFYPVAFPFTFVAVTILLMVCMSFTLPRLSPGVSRCLNFVGAISMIVFVVNGSLRSFTSAWLIDRFSIGYFPASVIHFFVVLLYSYLFYLVYVQMSKWLDKYLLSRL